MTLTLADVSVLAALFLVIALIVAGLCFWALFRWDKRRELADDIEYCIQQFHADWDEYDLERAAGDDGEGAYA